MSQAISVTTADFESEVLHASMGMPVLVDFWAPWCGPCRSLGPILDKLAGELAGRLKVTKVNTDEEPQLAALFGIRSLPTVVLMRDGQPVDGFMGAQPEGAIRKWLAPHLPPAPEADPEPPAAPARSEVDPEAAVVAARAALAESPDDAGRKLDLVEALLRNGNLDEARRLLDDLPAAEAGSGRATRLRSTLAFHDAIAGAPTVGELDARLQRNPDDHQARYQLGVRLLLDGDAPSALDAFLELMRRDRKYGDDLGRRALIQAFDLVEDADLVAQVRRRMSSLLF